MKHFEFVEFFRSFEDVQKEINMIEQEFSGILTWIGKTHVEKLASKSNFWSYICSYGSNSIHTDTFRFVVVHHSGAQGDQNYVHISVFR